MSTLITTQNLVAVSHAVSVCARTSEVPK